MLAEPLHHTTLETLLAYLPGRQNDAPPNYLFCDGKQILPQKSERLQKTPSGFSVHQPSKGSFELRIKDDHIMDEPIYMIHLLNDNPQHFIHLGRQSSAEIIEIFISSAETHFTLHPESQLKHCLLQRSPVDGRLHSQIHIHQKKSSRYHANTLLMGSLFNQSLLHLHLEEAYAEAKIYGIQQAKGSDKIEQTLTIHHQSPHCQTQVKTRGVAFDHSTLSFHGTIKVEKGAFKSDAALENKNLLLSEKAQIHTQPELDIHNADVCCTHGATVGYLDKEALFYLKSRGLCEKAAQDLLIHAFTEPMLEGLSKPFAIFIRGLLEGRLL